MTQISNHISTLKQTAFIANKGRFDALNSTYRHVIICTNGFPLQGYSKGENIDEPINKVKLLIDVSYRLAKSGYLTNRGIEITFYRRSHIIDNDVPVLILRKSNYEILDPELALHLPFTEYLKSLYTEYLKGAKIDPRPAKRFDDLKDTEKIDFEVKRFDSIEDLNQHCSNLLNKKYERSLVIAHWHKCKEKGFRK